MLCSNAPERILGDLIICRTVPTSSDGLVSQHCIDLYWKMFSNAIQKIGNCSDSDQRVSNNIQRLSAGASIMVRFCRATMLNKVEIPPLA